MKASGYGNIRVQKPCLWLIFGLSHLNGVVSPLVKPKKNQKNPKNYAVLAYDSEIVSSSRAEVMMDMDTLVLFEIIVLREILSDVCHMKNEHDNNGQYNTGGTTELHTVPNNSTVSNIT